MGGFSIGVQKKVLEGKGNLKLNVNDPFWLNHFNGRAAVQDIDFRVKVALGEPSDPAHVYL